MYVTPYDRRTDQIVAPGRAGTDPPPAMGVGRGPSWRDRPSWTGCLPSSWWPGPGTVGVNLVGEYDLLKGLVKLAWRAR